MDGMIPFGERRSTHKTTCLRGCARKEKYLLLSILIQVPKHPGIDISVFLEPLMQEMETLWNKGIDIFDGFARQHFNLRAIIFVTIHDYQTLFVLSGQIKGKTEWHCIVFP